ncbi:hypothetical protein [Streptomyces sp. C10-9-1]|uniref:hypothetical protein n=1 Tax=Streptomyces sp. C10-9-1 TaxID=1859285 RepID=UPI003D7279ED
MTTTVTVAAPAGALLGALGTGGVALVLAVMLVLGVRGRGRLKLNDNPAAITAFLAATAFSAAGKLWASPEQFVGQGLSGLGVGQGPNGPFGNVGLAAVATLILIVFLFATMTPLFGAVLGFIAGVIWPAVGPGTIWAIPAELAAAVLTMVGG